MVVATVRDIHNGSVIISLCNDAGCTPQPVIHIGRFINYRLFSCNVITLCYGNQIWYVSRFNIKFCFHSNKSVRCIHFSNTEVLVFTIVLILLIP